MPAKSERNGKGKDKGKVKKERKRVNIEQRYEPSRFPGRRATLKQYHEFLSCEIHAGRFPKLWIEKAMKVSPHMLDYCSRYQSTLLISAIGSFHSEAVVWLVANGADVDVRDKDGNTAYLEAVTRRDPYAEAFLVYKDAKVDVVDNEGRCASFIKWQYAQLENGKRANA